VKRVGVDMFFATGWVLLPFVLDVPMINTGMG
jgi:hypothetical protein